MRDLKLKIDNAGASGFCSRIGIPDNVPIPGAVYDGGGGLFVTVSSLVALTKDFSSWRAVILHPVNGEVYFGDRESEIRTLTLVALPSTPYQKRDSKAA